MTVERGPLWRDRRGVSLVEIMVAMALFGVGVLALTATGTVSVRNLQAGKSYQAASMAATGKLDSLRGLGWAALAGESGADTVLGYPMAWAVTGDNPRVLQLKVVMAQATDQDRTSAELTKLEMDNLSIAPIDADVTYQKVAVEAGVDIHVALVSK